MKISLLALIAFLAIVQLTLASIYEFVLERDCNNKVKLDRNTNGYKGELKKRINGNYVFLAHTVEPENMSLSTGNNYSIMDGRCSKKCFHAGLFGDRFIPVFFARFNDDFKPKIYVGGSTHTDRFGNYSLKDPDNITYNDLMKKLTDSGTFQIKCK